MMFPKKIAHRLLSGVQFLIILLSMTIMIAVVVASAIFLSRSKLSSLRSRSLITADELVSLLELPLYNVDNEASIRIAKDFLSSGKISGIELRSMADGILFTELSGQDSPGIPSITRYISTQDMTLGSFTITFSDAEIQEDQKLLPSSRWPSSSPCCWPTSRQADILPGVSENRFRSSSRRLKKCLQAITRPRPNRPSTATSIFWSKCSTPWPAK